MGTPLVADLFLFSFEFDFMKVLISKSNLERKRGIVKKAEETRLRSHGIS